MAGPGGVPGRHSAGSGTRRDQPSGSQPSQAAVELADRATRVLGPLGAAHGGAHDGAADDARARAAVPGRGTDQPAPQPLIVETEGQSIVTVARERSADLIVIGTREPPLLVRLLGNAVSDVVTHHARCDVLIVH